MAFTYMPVNSNMVQTPAINRIQNQPCQNPFPWLISSGFYGSEDWWRFNVAQAFGTTLAVSDYCKQ